MGLVIGMDEAGYGPNLGPLVVTATVWEVPDPPEKAPFWSAFAPVCSNDPPNGSGHIHVADSKEVYSRARGLSSLERSVLCILQLLGTTADSFHQLCGLVSDPDSVESEPWHRDCDVPLPVAGDCSDVEQMAQRWQACCQQQGIHLKAIRCEVVGPQTFNELVRASDSKGLALSRISLRLLRQVWEPDSVQPTLILADKHGGRNRYDELIDEVLDGQMIFRQQEGRLESCYTVGSSRLRFAVRSETHFPVAVASMVSKYIRELAMLLFNQYWSQHLPGLKPTAGYPNDARRFKQDIEAVQVRLGISDDVLWRQR